MFSQNDYLRKIPSVGQLTMMSLTNHIVLMYLMNNFQPLRTVDRFHKHCGKAWCSIEFLGLLNE